MDLIQEALLEELEKTAPRRVLCIADGQTASLDAYLGRHDDCVVERPDPASTAADPGKLGRYDIGLVCGVLEQLSAEHGSTLLARLRDVHCRRLYVTWRQNGHRATEGFWTHERLLSMALALLRRVDQDGMITGIYRYDIDSYNPRREWNNPDKWAHPENFGRFRW